MTTEYSNEYKDDEPLPGDDLGSNEAPSQGVKILTNELKDDEILAETTTTLKGISSQTYIPDETGGLQTNTIISPGDFVPNTDEKVKKYFTTIIPLLLETGTDDTLVGWTRGNGTANDNITAAICPTFTTNGSPTWRITLPGSGSQTYHRTTEGKILRIKFYSLYSPNAVNDVASVGIIDNGDILNLNDDETSVANSVRIIAVDATGNIWASNGNGVTNTSTEITNIDLFQWHIFEIVFDPGVSAKFYVDSVLKATHTTNLPTITQAELAFGIKDNDGAGGCNINISPVTVSWEF